MNVFRISAAAAFAASLTFAVAPAFAQQGTTLAGPAQGSKSNGSASTRPSGETGASTGASSSTSSGGATATGTGDSKTTATGGSAGGAAGRN